MLIERPTIQELYVSNMKRAIAAPPWEHFNGGSSLISQQSGAAFMVRGICAKWPPPQTLEDNHSQLEWNEK